MSVPGCKQRLAHLRHLLESRTASFKKIVRLRGRLEMLLQRAQANTQTIVDFSQAQIPLVEVYESSMIPKEKVEEEVEEEEDEEEEEEEEEMMEEEEEEEEEADDEDEEENSLLDDDEEEENEEDDEE